MGEPEAEKRGLIAGLRVALAFRRARVLTHSARLKAASTIPRNLYATLPPAVFLRHSAALSRGAALAFGASEQLVMLRDAFGWAKSAGEGSDYTDNEPLQCLQVVASSTHLKTPADWS